MDKPVLSICIPTYNRPQALKMALDSIVSQLATSELRAQVEIVVTDDAGSKQTPDVVKLYQESYLLVYHRNNPRLKFDLNYAKSVTSAHGEYCWTLGDDDVIASGAIAFIVEYLSRNKIATMTVEDLAYVDDQTLREMLAKPVFLTEDIVTFVSDPQTAFEGGYVNGATSSYIFSRESWLACLDTENFSREWLYFENIMKMLPVSPVKRYAHLRTPVVYLGQECAWAKDGYELFIFLSWVRMWKKMESYGYSKQMVDKRAKRLPSSLLIMLARAKGHGLPYRWAEYKLMFAEFKNYPFYLAFATLIYLTPNFFIRWMRDGRKIFIKK